MSKQRSEPQVMYGAVVTPTGIIDDGALVIQDGILQYVGNADGIPTPWKHATSHQVPTEENSSTLAKIPSSRGYLLPGFIDIHVHGGNGEDFMDSSKKVLDTITSFHASQGTTSMLATTMTAPRESIEHVLDEVHAYRQQDMPYAQLLGVHLEGPFLSPKWPGAQNPEHIVLPNLEWVRSWAAQYPDLIRQLTLAPEQEGALELIAWLSQQGITPALGHTDATYEEVQLAVGAGLRHAVHTFNAMTPLHHRKPGAAGAVLSDDRIEAEVIADGIHVHPAAVALLAKLKREHNLILITDAMSAAGLHDGNYTLGDLPVVVKDGVARLEDGVTLAGSTLTMIRGFRFLIEEAGMSLVEVSLAASLNPARSIGMADRIGSLEQGKQADILRLSPELALEEVWIHGRQLQMNTPFN